MRLRFLTRLLHQRHKPKCFQEECARQGCDLYPVDLGFGQVPIAQIVGTNARCRDLRGSRSSIARMKRRLQKKEAVPLVYLLKLGSELYLKEGHAQVQAAKELGMDQVDAHVIEYMPSTSSLEGLLARERAEFEQKTGLTSIHLTFPGRYAMLLHQIREHHAYLEETRGHLFLPEEAVADWWQNIYSPVIAGLQRDGVLDNLSELTAADVYSYLTEYLEEETRAARTPLSQAIIELAHMPNLDWREKLGAIVPPCLFGGSCSCP